MFTASARLRDAYVDTDYITRRGTLAVGAWHPAIDRLLARHRAKTAVFVSACNPQGGRAARGVNAARHARLRAEIRSLGLRAVPGIGVGRSGGWPAEISLLVFGVTKPRAARIGRRWRQNAVVFAARRQKVALLPLR